MRVRALPYLTFLLSSVATAADFAVGGQVGTLGLGVELTAGLGPQVNARLGGHFGSHDDRRVADDIEYDATADVRAGKALLDWHPGGGSFRLSGGAVFNGNEVEGESLPPASGFYEIGDVQVPVALLGTLRGQVEWDSVAPYAGLGFGNPFGGDGGWSFAFDLGVIFQGEPQVTLTPIFSPGSPLDNPVGRALLRTQLDEEERNLEEEFSDFDLYPVLAFGVSYRF